MSRLVTAPIVEGHGEVHAIRTLLQRIWIELLKADHLEVLQPIRVSRFKLTRPDELLRAIDLAALKLVDAVAEIGDPTLVLVLLDANGDPPCILGPRLLGIAARERRHLDVSCVVANVEYETWFVAGAESLGEFLRLPSAAEIPGEPEASGHKKAWIEGHFRGRYTETVDQPRLTAAMDLHLCRQRSPSFDKLVRELERRLG